MPQRTNSPAKSELPSKAPSLALKTKNEIVANWFPRYTGTAARDFGKYVLLVNFSNYVDRFAKVHGVEVRGVDRPMPNATADGISILKFRNGQRAGRHRDGFAYGGETESG